MATGNTNRMNKPLIKDFLICTFGLMLLGWGSCAIFSQLFELTVNSPILRVLFFIGGFSPTIASYAALKRNHSIGSFKEWLNQVFDVKHHFYTYICVILFVSIYYLLGCIINGFQIGTPAFMLIVIVPMMLFSGGNEEVGWRMILQPELEKKFGFHFATWITAAIWWIWHLPLFFIRGTANSNMDFFLFGSMCLALSYALATIRKISNGVFPCILTHCFINGLSATLVFQLSATGCIATLIATICLSILICHIYNLQKSVQSFFISNKPFGKS